MTDLFTTQPDTTDPKRRGRAIGGAVAGVAVVAVLVAVFIGVRASNDDEPTAAAPAPAASAPAAEQPAEPPAAGLPEGTNPELAQQPEVTGGEGDLTELKVTELIPGTGPAVTAGQTLTVNYTGIPYAGGEPFDSSWSRGEPASFPVGVGQLIPGWDQGLVGVKVGSRVQLDVPADLAYGEQAEGGRPSGDLRFVVDILAAQ